MDKLSGLNQIVQVLRRQLAARPDAAARTGATRNNESPDAPALSRASVEELRTRIGRRIKNLPEDDERERHAIHVFVEAVLAWEFGEGLLNDARTGELTEKIRDQMLADTDLRDKMNQLIMDLTR